MKKENEHPRKNEFHRSK